MRLGHILNRIFAFLLFVAITIVMNSYLYAQETTGVAQRSVELELEAIEGATNYEIELISLANKKVLNFKMKNPVWKAKVRPGLYEMRLRSFDSRGVPGEWSAAEKFAVNFAAPTLIAPVANEKKKTGEDGAYATEFKWSPVPGAKKYRVTVQERLAPKVLTTPEGTTVQMDAATGDAPPAAAAATPDTASMEPAKTFTDTTDETSLTIKLPVAMAYEWTVVALMQNNEEGDKPEASVPFELLAEPIETPDIDRPEDKYVQKISWDRPDNVETFDYSVQRKENGVWKTVARQMGTSSNELIFSNEWQGGDYRLNVRATGKYREPSKFSSVEFPVHAGDRSPAAVEVARLQESMQKPTQWYAMASYLLTDIAYEALDSEQGKTVSYGAIGGTGRLGLGYFNKARTKGFIGVLDMSGMNVGGKNITYSALDLNYVRAYYWNSNQIQVSTGLFYKELPYSTEVSPKVYEHAKVAFAGPHAGAVLWHPFSPKYGLQVNGRLYMSTFTMATPNGNDVEPSLSMQLGLMGSMRLSNRLMGFAGWAYRNDHIAYKRGPKSTTAPTADTQEISLQGNYINLLLEYGF